MYITGHQEAPDWLCKGLLGSGERLYPITWSKNPIDQVS